MNINWNTKLYCLIGNPIDKTLSPVIHNEVFKILNENSVYLAFNIEQNMLEDAVIGLKAMNVQGFNVTIPYKKSIMKYLDEISPQAKILGAVNTVKNENGKFIGYNTDGEGFLQTFIDNNIEVKNKNILLLGAGGAAFAIGITLSLNGVKSIYIVNRTKEKGINLEKEIKKNNEKIITHVGDFTLKDIDKKDIDIIINATSIGMYPMENMSPIELNGFEASTIVYDIVYKPRETKLIREAKDKKFRTFNGISMLLNQGILSQKIWLNLGEESLEKFRKLEGILSTYVE